MERLIEINGVYIFGESVACGELRIIDGSSVSAPDGKLAVLTVDGVQMGFEPGVYMGDIQITVTDSLVTPVTGKSGSTNGLSAALVLDKNGLDETNSVISAYMGDELNSIELSGGQITSKGDFLTPF